jgi:DNA repair protein RadD
MSGDCSLKITAKTLLFSIMLEIWSFLGKARLQELIGEDVLTRLETLLPALDPKLTPHTIYSSEGLASVFNAFSGGAQLELPKFRLELFNSLPPDRMSHLLKVAGKSSEGLDWPAKVDTLTTAWKSPLVAEAIINALGIPGDFLTPEQILPPANLLHQPVTAPYKPLKDYQVPVASKSAKHIESPLARFVVQMPTGSGKTRTAMEIIAEVLNERPNGTVVIWLAHSEELCEQAYDCFLEVWSHVARRPLRLIRSWGADSSLPFEFSESAFIVGGFTKLYARLKKFPVSFSYLAPKVFLVVVDEAHKIVAPTYNEVIRALMGNQTRVMGLTATPGRSVGNEVENEQLAKFFFNQIVGLDGGSEGVVTMLQKRGVLAQPEYVPLRTSQMFQLNSKEKAYLAQFFDLPPGLLARLADDDVRNVEIIRRLQEEFSRGGQIIFFGCSVEHSKFICALLNFLGIKAVHLDGTTNRARRQALINDFRNGKVRILCNYALLSTGFDAPKTDVVFISRPTGSIVLYSQMIGRGLRGPAIGGTEKCRIIDVIDNIQGFSDSNRVYTYFEGYFKPEILV